MQDDRQLRLADRTFEEVRDLVAGGLWGLLPVGSTEAHGPHLPLSTDVIIAETAAIRAARKLRVADSLHALVLPPIAYSVTDFAAGFHGTISLTFETAKACVRDVLVGAANTGFRGVVVCNAHLEPEHIRSLATAVEDAQAAGVHARFPDVTRKPHALRLGEEFRSGACHAGQYETSLVLAASPFAVKQELAEELPPNPRSLSVAIREGLQTFEEAGGPNAYFGAPAAATSAEGDRHYDELADIFAHEVRAMANPR